MNFFKSFLLYVIFGTIILKLVSCKNNDKTNQTLDNTSGKIKKYSEFTGLEKMNLKGDVVGIKDYGGFHFYFINNNGNIDKSYFYYDDKIKSFSTYLYTNDKLINVLHLHENIDNSIACFNEFFYYDNNSNLISRIQSYSIGKEPDGQNFTYDKNGFPNETFNKNTGQLESKSYWNNGELDSVYHYNEKMILDNIEYFKNGRIIKFLFFNNSGEIERNSSRDYQYFYDRNGNDIKYITTSYLGFKDSSERIIFYKGDEISNYLDRFQNLVTEITNTGNRTFNK